MGLDIKKEDEENKKTAWLLCLVIIVIYLIPYSIVNSLPLQREYLPFIFGEERIPLLPWTFFIYASAYIQVIIVIRHIPKKLLKRGLILASVLVATSLLLFILLPINYPRELYQSDSVFINLYRILDPSGNCFPSLHVSIAIFLSGCYSMFEKSKTKRTLMWLWTLLIIISVLTTKQHYLADVFGAIILTIPFIFLFKRHVKTLS